MKKDFYRWYLKKSRIHDKGGRPEFNVREIWYCHLGANIGFEQDGHGRDFLRPVVVLKKFNPAIFWSVPLTRTIKNGSFYYVFSLNSVPNAAILSQLKLVDSKRLSHKIGLLSELDYLRLKEKLKALLP